MTDQLLVPCGWQSVQLADVADVAFSGVDKKIVEGELPVKLCNYTDVFYNRRITSHMTFMTATATTKEHAKWRLQKGDVLFTKDSETREELGIAAYVVEDLHDTLCGYHLCLARPKPNAVDGRYLAEALATTASRIHFSRVANGTTRFGLTLATTRALSILLPPLHKQRAIAAALHSIDAAIECATAEHAHLNTLRRGLAEDLLTGQQRARTHTGRIA